MFCHSFLFPLLVKLSAADEVSPLARDAVKLCMALYGYSTQTLVRNFIRQIWNQPLLRMLLLLIMFFFLILLQLHDDH
jgi:hypothetical protein